VNRYCASCGSRVQIDAIYCGICGAPLGKASGSETRPRKPIRAFVGLILAATVVTVGGLTWGSLEYPIFDPAPPGKIVQQLRASLTGKWPPEIVVLTKTTKVNADPEGQKQLSQDHLIVYQYGLGKWHQLDALPRSGDTRESFIVPTLSMYPMPIIMETTITGAADFLGDSHDQLVIDEYMESGDCGGTTTSVLSLDETKLRVVIRANDDCSMSSSVEGKLIILSGPYYAITAPLCCPTIEGAKATLSFQNQRWQESPAYFKVSDGAGNSLIKRGATPPQRGLP
jgi:hypothetical protein